jgi:hypothetical protein
MVAHITSLVYVGIRKTPSPVVVCFNAIQSPKG